MSSINNYFIPFEQPNNTAELPKSFTFPFYYKPHPLCLIVANELQQYLLTKYDTNKEISKSGKMFGVLLVKNKINKLGYLTAYSGKSNTLEKLNRFVPAISNEYEINEIFTTEQKNINQLTTQLNQLENNPTLHNYQNELNTLKQQFSIELTEKQRINAEKRKHRKTKRVQASDNLSLGDINNLLAQLAIESVSDKNEILVLKTNWQEAIKILETKLTILNTAIEDLKSERQQRSSMLQAKLFQQYQLLNSNGDTKSLNDIFKPTPQHIPPAGSGDCAAPKLLQYAFLHNLTPMAMAEFWWGTSPKSEVRQHKNYYPACIGKCEPILNWMLKGMAVDANPLLQNAAEGKDIEIIYQDSAIAIINKPSGYLSVPGKHIKDSVQTRIQELIPTASGPIVVHRLDMCTSGLMVIALTKRSHKALQKQFINRTIHKRYIALLEGNIETNILLKNNEQTGSNKTSGIITLPLVGDLHDRPRQKVCYTHGKHAETFWKVVKLTTNSVEQKNEHHKVRTKVYLYPKTGRTHQLRVHCAHQLGLNTPIVGDDLYGKGDNRLHLHAETIELDHPLSKERLSFQIDAEF